MDQFLSEVSILNRPHDFHHTFVMPALGPEIFVSNAKHNIPFTRFEWRTTPLFVQDESALPCGGATKVLDLVEDQELAPLSRSFEEILSKTRPEGKK